MQHRTRILLVGVLVAGCTSSAAPAPTDPPPSASAPLRTISEVSCGGLGFPISLLDEPGRAETFDDPAAEALRQVLSETDPEAGRLPDSGWREVARTDTEVVYVADAAPHTDAPYATVTVVREDDAWLVAGWSDCRLQAGVGPDSGLASFRVAPDEELASELTEIPVLVTERACNSGQDARGRIAEPLIVLGGDAVTVVFAVRPRAGGHDCPSNPETPHLLVLPEPLGDRSLLDGSEFPARDATLCANGEACPP